MIRRCAIYTRKSTEDGLDQAFNSLDAQREACEAYIASQKGEGWRAVKSRYDDGGLSGGNMDRPALQALLKDIDAGRIDIIVVYKVDRLTRSLADFAKLVERFDKHDVSFVSVTQQFNTSNSMGRLTLNVLLSFAQFEREVGAERVRDKIAASRRKGLWTGGLPPLGYDNLDRALVVNEAEAKIVREIYRLYLETGCVRTIIRIAEEKGWTTKRRANGKGGLLLTRGPVYHILQNPVYAGLLRSGDCLHDGKHNALIDRNTWQAVQEKRADRTQWTGSVRGAACPLAGKLYVDGQRMTPSHASKAGRRYRYYISHANEDANNRIRLPAGDVEAAVFNAIKAWLAKPDAAAADSLKRRAPAKSIKAARGALTDVCVSLNGTSAEDALRKLGGALTRVEINGQSLKLVLNPERLLSKAQFDLPLMEHATIKTEMELRRRGNELRLILGDCETPRPPDETLLALLARAHRWKQAWFAGDSELKAILEAEGADATTAHRTIRLAFLAPDIIEKLLEGTAPAAITAESLRRLPDLPSDWKTQSALLG